MVIFGRSLVSWIIAIVAAVLVFLLVTQWPVPQVLAMIGLGIPGNILVVIGLLLALLVLFGHYRGAYYRNRAP